MGSGCRSKTSCELHTVHEPAFWYRMFVCAFTDGSSIRDHPGLHYQDADLEAVDTQLG